MFDPCSKPFALRLLAPDTFDVYLDDKTLFYQGSVEIIGAVNGLVCFKGRKDDELYLYNPCLKQHKIITAESTISDHPKYFPMHTEVFGFGYDSRNNDYKIVRYLSHAEVFTLRMDSWRNVGILPYDVRLGLHKGSCFFNGAIHNLAIERSTSKLMVLSFDTSIDVFGQFPRAADSTVR